MTRLRVAREYIEGVEEDPNLWLSWRSLADKAEWRTRSIHVRQPSIGISRAQNPQYGEPDASIRRVAPAGTSWTATVLASTVPSFRIRWT